MANGTESTGHDITDVSHMWEPWEGELITGWKDLLSRMDAIHNHHDDRQFVWRGATNAKWALNSSLYRRLWWTRAQSGNFSPPTEKDLLAEEQRVLNEAYRWGLHSGSRGRLSTLELLATLQHYGVPTRLIDVSFNPLIAAFFAAENTDDVDGRVFAVDVTKLLINNNPDDRAKFEVPTGDIWSPPPKDWCLSFRAWRPAAFDHRIAAQMGGFLFGGVPKTDANAQGWPKKPSDTHYWTVDEVRAASSIRARPNKQGSARPAGNPIYTLRIAASAKEEIRKVLQLRFGIEHASVYRDPPGMAAHGVPGLVSKPPSSR